MQIIEEKIDDLNLTLNIEIKPEDYKNSLEKSIKSYAKKMDIPGFRPGRVPAGIIRKKYGKALLAEELNKIVQDSLDKYIDEKKLGILGYPLPNENNTDPGNWDNPGDFIFKYDLGLAPDFEVKIDKRTKHDYLVIKVEDNMVDEHIKNLRKQHGTFSNVEESADTDILVATLVELDQNDEIVEGGIMHDSYIAIEQIKDEKTRKKLTGLKPGDHVVVDPHKISTGDQDLARQLGIDPSTAGNINTNFRINVKEIKRMEPAKLDREFFDKMGKPGEINNVDELKAKIKSDTEKQFERESDRLFFSEMQKLLIEKSKIELPDGFLKRFIKTTSEKPVSDEQIDTDYDNYATSLKWQLIENKLLEQAEIRITEEDLLNAAKQNIAAQFIQYGLPEPEEDVLNQHAKQMLSDQKESRKLVDMLAEKKILEYLKEAVKRNVKEVSYDKFIEAVQRN